MFGPLFRRSAPTARPAVRCTLRLEPLNGRITPGGSQVSVMHVGEEIPQTVDWSGVAVQRSLVTGHVAHVGHVDYFGGGLVGSDF